MKNITKSNNLNSKVAFETKFRRIFRKRNGRNLLYWATWAASFTFQNESVLVLEPKIVIRPRFSCRILLFLQELLFVNVSFRMV